MMNAQSLSKASPLSAGLVRYSMLIYILWLVLPAVQTTGGALTGAAAVAVFVLGVALDTPFLRRHWRWFVLAGACAALVPLALRFFLQRGGVFWGFYAQQGMFWYPLIYCAYARMRGDARLWRWAGWVLLGAMALTTLTTIGWLIEGMLRGGRVYAYSRSLGYAGEGREAYLEELMLRNIGGSDFIYATVVALPLTLIGAGRTRGWARIGFLVFFVCQLAVILLSQYTYAMLFAAAITAVELLALLIRRLSREKCGMGRSLLLGAAPLVLAAVFIQPLVSLAASLCAQLGLTNFAFSFEQLLLALRGETVDEAARLGYYLTALDGFTASPLVGSMFSSSKSLSLHSEILDLLSGMGVLGTAVLGGMAALMGRGLLRGVRQCPYRAQLCLSAVALFFCALLGTVFYSREIALVLSLGAAAILEARDGESRRAMDGENLVNK